MKIKVLRNLGAGLPDYTEGQEVCVEDNEGRALCKRGLAVLLEETPVKKEQPKQAEAKEPEVNGVPESPKVQASETKESKQSPETASVSKAKGHSKKSTK